MTAEFGLSALEIWALWEASQNRQRLLRSSSFLVFGVQSLFEFLLHLF